MTAIAEREPVVAAPREHAQLAQIERLLESTRAGRARLVGPDGSETALPTSLYRVLLSAVRELALGNGVSILPAETELSTQRAADILNVSRPYLIRLLERGDLSFRRVGSHRRIRLVDLLDYKRTRDAERRRLLDEMVREAEDVGAYEEFYAAGRALRGSDRPR
ncbi:MAG TPA: helix-turn-helix domain-containing protein [Candidatus Limnocylindrales bacterium]|nr:helix-turn-helix domain-containing protein [Candidatus Limnocylindrales bacterium]